MYPSDRAVRIALLTMALPLLGGCASSELTKRLAAAERDIRTLDRNDATFQRSLQTLVGENQRYADQLRRIEAVLSHQARNSADLQRAAREALSIAQESAAVTRRLEIRQLGETPIITVKP